MLKTEWEFYVWLKTWLWVETAVGYLTESMHGAGSPQAQRIQIARQMQLGYKKKLAKDLAKVQEQGEETIENADYFKRVFKLDNSKE